MPFLTRAPEKTTMIPLYNQQQQSGVSSILQQALQRLANPTAGFEPIAQEARNQFKSQTIPSIAERFGNSGSDRGSSALIGQLGAAGSQLDQALSSLKAQYGLQQQGEARQQAGLGLTQLNENIFQPEQASGLENLLMAFLSGGGGESAGNGIGSLLKLLAMKFGGGA